MNKPINVAILILIAFSAFTFAQDEVTTLLQKANAGDPASEVKLGTMYAFGQSVPRDSQEALKWFTRAADQGDAAGQFALGAMYETGRAVQQDLTTAVKW